MTCLLAKTAQYRLQEQIASLSEAPEKRLFRNKILSRKYVQQPKWRWEETEAGTEHDKDKNSAFSYQWEIHLTIH